MDRLTVEKIIVTRTGRLLAAVGLSATADGANPDLADAIAQALLTCGYPVEDLSNPTAAEVEAVQLEDRAALLDITELRTLKLILNAASALVDVSLGSQKESLSKIADNVRAAAAAKTAEIAGQYGGSSSGFDFGVLSLGVEDADYPGLGETGY